VFPLNFPQGFLIFPSRNEMEKIWCSFTSLLFCLEFEEEAEDEGENPEDTDFRRPA
jgi:hypothetical protein